jgi:pimeloyl-ACP methyl ester carboxylesterase
MFTELEWAIRPELESWADVATFDAPGVGDTPLPEEIPLSLDLPPAERVRALQLWRDAVADRALEEADRHGWRSYVIVGDSQGIPSALGAAAKRPQAVEGLALGHAMLENRRGGERPTIVGEVWDAVLSLIRTDSEAFIRYGIAQMTRGSVSEELADQMIQRFPNFDLGAMVWEAMGEERNSIRETLEDLDPPLLLAQHSGCLTATEEGFEEIVAAFPEASVVRCPEAPDASPAFAKALRAFCRDAAPARRF